MKPRQRWGKRALPDLLQDERILWQGGPAWRSVARRVFRAPAVACYFVLLTLLDMAITRIHEGPGWPVVHAAAPTVLSGAACVVVLLLLAWCTARTTSYVLTTERIVLQFGVALPATLSIPLHRVAASSARVRRDHTGDIALCLKDRGGLTFVKLWPHVRPWRLGRVEPMLRDIPQAGALAPILCRALAACDAAQQCSPGQRLVETLPSQDAALVRADGPARVPERDAA